MNNNYMIYPMKTMKITQNYLGKTSHLPHTTGNPKDYPIDDGGKDSGRDAIYCPCDEMKVTNIKGYRNPKVTNTIWLVSTTKVITPTFEDICFMTLTHENDSDLQKIKIGDTFKRGEIICYEGSDGATANHIHIVVGKGSSSDWVKSTTGSWVIKGDTKKPEEIFFIDRNFTSVMSTGGLNFRYLNNTVGTPTNKDSSKEQVNVLVDNLNARENASTTSKSLGYVKKGIYDVIDKVKLENEEWLEIENFWIYYNPTWMEYYSKKEDVKDIEDIEILDDLPRLIFECKNSNYYKIYLKENSKLYLKDF